MLLTAIYMEFVIRSVLKSGIKLPHLSDQPYDRASTYSEIGLSLISFRTVKGVHLLRRQRVKSRYWSMGLGIVKWGAGVGGSFHRSVSGLFPYWLVECARRGIPCYQS